MKSKINPLGAALVLLLLTLAIYSPFRTESLPEQPLAVNGELDASLWDFSEYGTLRLNGNWTAYWKRLVAPGDMISGVPLPYEYASVPKMWDKQGGEPGSPAGTGFATFRLLVRLPSSDGMMALRIPAIASSYKLWINGRPLAENGAVAASPGSMKPGEAVRTVVFQPAGSSLDIVIQISNFVQRKGGIWDAIELGEERQLTKKTMNRIAFDSFLFGCLLLAGLHHTGLYLFRNKNKLALFFGLFCLVTGFRSLFVGEDLLIHVWPGFPWELSRKIEYIGMLAAVPVFIRFLHHTFPAEVSARWMKYFQYCAFLFVGIVVVFPANMYTHLLCLFQAFVLCGIVYTFCVLPLAIRRSRAGAAPFFAASVVFALSTINDLLYFNGLIRTGSISPYGILVFVVLQTYMLARTFSGSFGKIEELSRKLLSADRLKDEFLTHTSQELRVPLGTIVGIAETMLESAAGAGLSAVHRTNLSVIANSGKRLAASVDDLLDFYQLRDRHTMRIRKRPVDLQQMAQVVLSASKPLAFGKDIALRNEIGPDIPFVLADEAHLQQLLVHLVSFSVDHSHSSVIAVSARERGTAVVVEVAVAGQSLSAEELSALREKIASDRMQGGNSEVVVATAKKLIELNGGELLIETSPHEGMTFVFTLPSSTVYTMPIEEVDENLHAIENLLAQMVRKDDSRERSPHILIVDDEPVNLQVLYGQLSTESYSISTATTGQQAVRMIRETNSFDLIILDAIMPKMSGFEVCRTIRRDYSLMELPILMLYAKKQPEIVYEGFEAGINDYMMKPIDKKELLTRVKTLLTLKRAIREATRHTGELEELNRQLTELNNGLEEKIAERTLSLQQSKQQLEAMNEDLERIERSRIRLLTNISHDLRTPITSIQGYIEAILDGVVTDPEETQKYLRLIHSKSLTLNRLIQDLFELAQLESRQAAFRMREVLTTDLVRLVKEKFELDVSARGVRFEVCDTLSQPVVLNVDTDRLDQVFANLIFNAIKFTPRQGTIVIGFEKRPGRAFKDELIVKVADSGTGITDEELPHIFDRFYKGTPRNNSKKGSGLGLAIAKEIVEYHGGRIWAESETGQGCTVYFTLPIFY
ncbi:response regulator [Paenibacillus mesophilus]|uniref:ATP-binding protein n=1 Tax=Paenibacillus mesophilus TaxID=2582849 RepID=UPI00110F045D|nr:ATP-binding protein [Paenibacillus mesophilus]TMV46393.1 response regulator [Paenibacillus mesophilus]